MSALKTRSLQEQSKATKTLSGTRCERSRWRRTVITAAAMITAPSARPTMRLAGGAIRTALIISSPPVNKAPPARVAPPHEITLRPGRADRVEEACAKESGNEPSPTHRVIGNTGRDVGRAYHGIQWNRHGYGRHVHLPIGLAWADCA